MRGEINLLANRLIVACIDTIDHPSIELVATHPLWWPSAREGYKFAAEAPLLAHLTNGANNGGIHPLFRSNLSFRCYARSDASLLLLSLLTLLLWLPLLKPYAVNRDQVIKNWIHAMLGFSQKYQKTFIISTWLDILPIYLAKKSLKHSLTFRQGI